MTMLESRPHTSAPSTQIGSLSSPLATGLRHDFAVSIPVAVVEKDVTKEEVSPKCESKTDKRSPYRFTVISAVLLSLLAVTVLIGSISLILIQLPFSAVLSYFRASRERKAEWNRSSVV